MPIITLLVFGIIYVITQIIEGNKRHKIYRSIEQDRADFQKKIDGYKKKLRVNGEEENELIEKIRNPSTNTQIIDEISDELRFIYENEREWQWLRGRFISTEATNCSLREDGNIIALVYLAKHGKGNEFLYYEVPERKGSARDREIRALQMIEKCMKEAHPDEEGFDIFYVPNIITEKGSELKQMALGRFEWGFMLTDKDRKMKLW